MSNHDGEIILTTDACLTLYLLPKALETVQNKEVRIHHLHLTRGLRSGRGAYRVIRGPEVIPFTFKYVDHATMELVVLDDTYKVQFDHPNPWETTVTKMYPVTILIAGKSEIKRM